MKLENAKKQPPVKKKLPLPEGNTNGNASLKSGIDFSVGVGLITRSISVA
jgi:hypothetical protein